MAMLNKQRVYLKMLKESNEQCEHVICRWWNAFCWLASAEYKAKPLGHWLSNAFKKVEAMANLNDTERPQDPTHMLPEFAKSAKCLATWVQ